MHKLPDSVNDFFRSVQMDCFPKAEGNHTKTQPWKRVWTPQLPSADGKLLIACPKDCQWGELYAPHYIHGMEADDNTLAGSGDGLGGY